MKDVVDQKTSTLQSRSASHCVRSNATGTRIGKILLSSLKTHAARSLSAAVLIVLSVILEVLPPLVLGNAVDALTGNQAVSMALAAGYFLLLACAGLASSLREALIVATGESFTHALRTAMMQKLHKLPASYFTSHEAGQIAALQVNDVDAIEDMFSSGLVSMCTDLGTVISILIVVAAKSRGLFVLLLVTLPLLFAFTRHVQKKMLAAHTVNRKATAEAGGILPETMHIIRSLHVYHAEDFAERRYDRAIQRSFLAMEKTNFYDAVYSPVIMTVSAAVIGVMMSLSGQSGAFRSWFGVSVGTAVAMIAYVNNIFTPLSSIGMEIQTIQSAAAGWKRVQGFLDEPEKVPVRRKEPVFPKNSQAAQPGRTMRSRETGTLEKTASSGKAALPAAIDIRDITFSYNACNVASAHGDGSASDNTANSRPVFSHFSLALAPGEFVTLTGRTGAGKSTLFKLILGLYTPQEGTIRLNGIAPEQMDGERRRQTICCVEQKVISVPGSIRDQVTLGNSSYSDEEVWKALETVGLAGTVTAAPAGLDAPYTDASFSQGQKQLLMIARAIVSNPSILLLDEITAGLDSATEQLVITALQKAAAGRTVLSISHRLSREMTGRIVSLP